MEDEKEKVGADATTEKNTGTTEVTETKKEEKVDYAEMMKTNKEFQSFVDSQKSQAISTAVANAKIKWEEESNARKAEADKLAKMDEDQKRSYALEQEKARADKAENELNAYKLKDETIRQAAQRGVSIEYLDTIDFSKETAESINSKLDIFEKVSKADREKAINEYSGEKAPQTGDKVDNSKSESQMTYEELSKLAKYKD